MAFLTREQIAGAERWSDLAFEIVPMPEWGGDICVVQLDAGESIALTKDMDRSEDATLHVCRRCARNNPEERGYLFFSETPGMTPEQRKAAKEADLALLRSKSFVALERIQKVAIRLQRGRIAVEAADEKKASTAETPFAALPIASRASLAT